MVWLDDFEVPLQIGFDQMFAGLDGRCRLIVDTVDSDFTKKRGAVLAADPVTYLTRTLNNYPAASCRFTHFGTFHEIHEIQLMLVCSHALTVDRSSVDHIGAALLDQYMIVFTARNIYAKQSRSE